MLQGLIVAKVQSQSSNLYMHAHIYSTVYHYSTTNIFTDYPTLASLARQVFSVPATSTTVEHVFSQAGKIISPLQCRMIPKNFVTLLFLKMNSQFM